MRHRQLPPDLQERVHRFMQYKWLATRGVHEESILKWLPQDQRREIQRHLCLGLVRRVCLPHLSFMIKHIRGPFKLIIFTTITSVFIGLPF